MRAILASAATVALLFGGLNLEAKTIAIPQQEPLFRMSIPDSWKTTWDKDGSVTCMPPNHSKYVSVIPSENVNSKRELRAQLSKTARDAAQNAKMKETKLGPITERAGPNGLSLMSVTAQGAAGGKPMVFKLVAFAPKKDNYFTVIALEPAGARDKEIGAIINSISSTTR